MTFEVTKSSDWNYKETVEINSLEELMDFIHKVKAPIIVDDFGMIEIYDDYRE